MGNIEKDSAESFIARWKVVKASELSSAQTFLYNVLEKVRSGEALTAKERTIHEHGLVSVLRQLHDELDIAVLDAYGWSDLLPLLRIAHGNDAPAPAVRGEVSNHEHSAAVSVRPSIPQDERGPGPNDHDQAKRAFDEAILERLVALNAERAAEEARGLVRWLRPEFQNPTAQTVPQQAEMQTDTDEATTTKPAVVAKPQPWPKDALDQVRTVANILAASSRPLTIDDIATRFTSRGAWKKRLPPLLEMLVALGRVRERRGRYSVSK